MSHIPNSAVKHAKPQDAPEQDGPENPASADTLRPAGEGSLAVDAAPLAAAPPANMENAGPPPQADAPPGSTGDPKDEAVPAQGPGKRPGPGAGSIVAIAGVAAIGIGGIVAAVALLGGRGKAKDEGKRGKRGRKKAA